MTKYNHSPSCRFFHGARSPEVTFQLFRKEKLSPHIHSEGWFSHSPCVQRDQLRLREVERESCDSSWNGANSQVYYRWRDCSPCETGPAPALFLLFSHFV